MPVFGVIGFTAIFAASFRKDAQQRKNSVQLLSYPAALIALGLVGLQAVLGDFCSLCLIVDTSAILIGGCVLALSRGGFDDAVAQEQSRTTLIDPTELLSEGQRVKDVWKDDSQYYQAPNPPVRPASVDPLRLKKGAWLALLSVAVLAPLGFSQLVATSETPSSIQELYEPGSVTVVEFFDFQCPHCRHLSPRLKKLVEAAPGVRLKFGYTPLPSHPLAREAARISICAAELGKEKEVTSAFFASENMDSKHLLSVAKGLVDEPSELDSCLASKRPDARIESDTARIKAAGFEGLPTTYIGEARLLGSLEDTQYQEAIRRAQEGIDGSGANPYTYWAAVFAVLVGIALMGRVPAPERTSIV